jgi:hypothetical protein
MATPPREPLMVLELVKGWSQLDLGLLVRELLWPAQEKEIPLEPMFLPTHNL